MLAAATVSSTGRLTLWWSHCGKSGVSWSRMEQNLGVHLLPAAAAGGHPAPRVHMAHVTCAANNTVRVAMVASSDPTAVILVEVCVRGWGGAGCWALPLF